MQKYLTPDLKYKLRQAIPYTIVTILICIYTAWSHSYFTSDLKKIHEEVRDFNLKNRETNDRIDAMACRMDHVWQVLVMMAGGQIEAKKPAMTN